MGLKQRIREAIRSFIDKGVGWVGYAKNLFATEYKLPANLADYERIYKEDGIVNAAIEQTVAAAFGNGFYTSIETEMEESTGKPRKPTPREQAAKDLVNKFCEENNLDEQNIIYGRSTLIYGNCYVEKLGYKRGRMEGLKILPTETMKRNRTNLGVHTGYTQTIRGEHETVEFKTDQILHFRNNVIDSSQYGVSDIACVYDTISELNQIDEDYLKIIRRYAAPKIIWKLPAGTSPEEKTKFEEQTANIPIDKDPIIVGDVEHDIVDIKSQGKFGDIYDMLMQKVQTGLKTPLLSYLRNATEASAKTMFEYFEVKVAILQRSHKRLIENEVFRALLDQNGFEDVNTIRLNWGLEKTGVEDVDLNILAGYKNAGILSGYQSREILRKLGWDIEEETVSEEPEQQIPMSDEQPIPPLKNPKLTKLVKALKRESRNGS